MKLQNNFFLLFQIYSHYACSLNWEKILWSGIVFFFLNMQNACKGRKGKSFCTKNTGHCFDMVEYRRGVVLGGVSKLTTIQKFW